MKKNILVLDPKPSSREKLLEFGKDKSYQLIFADKGELVFNLVDEQPISLVIVELNLPDMNGVEVVKWLYHHHPEISVLIYTAEKSFDAALTGIRSKVEDYLLKPTKLENLLTTIEEIMALREFQKEKELLYKQIDRSLLRLKSMDQIQDEVKPTARITPVAHGVMYDLDQRLIWREGKKRQLTPTEADLLRVFLSNRGRVMTHSDIIVLVRGEEPSPGEAPEILRPWVSRLRAKLRPFMAENEEWIKNIRGSGYTFDERNR